MPTVEQSVSNIDFTKTQLGVLLVATLLAVDAINPIKIVMHVFPAIHPWHIATLCFILGTYIWISEFKELLYFCVKSFFQSILSIFFRDVEIIGREQIPRHGPVIFTVNHANQFIDAVSLLCTCQRKVSYLIAEASWRRPIIGDMAWALGAVPVKRAQDAAKKGKGTVKFEEKKIDTDTTAEEMLTGDKTDDKEKVEARHLIVHGTGTNFSEVLAKGDKIRPEGTAAGAKVMEIISDTIMHVDASDAKADDPAFLKKEPTPFDILKRVDQKVVYEKVIDRLASGGAIGIFPEGGSHDRTDLLPLKVGVALIAYNALEKDGINIPIVPVGLSYFQAHRWRGRAVVEYGVPIYIEPTTLKSFQAGGMERRRVCNELLDCIQDSMKSVIVTAPDYETLQLIHTARRLYQRRGLDGKEKQDLSRRFAEGYRRLLLSLEGEPPKEWKDLQDRMLKYQRELRELGIRDYQVLGLDRTQKDVHNLEDIDGDLVLREIRLPYQIVHLLFLLMLAAIPTLFLNLPVGVLAGLYSERRRKKALAKSKVKIRAYDVMLTEKVMFCIIAIPTMWMIYGLVFYFFTDFDGPTIALCIFSMPLFAYVGIVVAEAGMVDWKDLRPYFMRLFPSSRRRLAALPATRRQLAAELRAFIRQIGPAMGDLYYEKNLDWKEIQEKSRLAQLQNLATDAKKEK